MNKQRLAAVQSVAVLLISMVLCGLLAVSFGKELNWDLANYHYYNPFVFLHQRWLMDYWPTSFVHVYFTPTLDFLTYFLINNFAPKTAIFMLGALHGINIWLLFCIARLLLKTFHQVRYPDLFALILALLGMYGPTALTGIGSFQHDDLVSLFVLGFVYLQLTCWIKYTQTQKMPRFLFTSAGVLLGLGIGGKLTAAVFAVGAGAALLLIAVPWRQRIGYLVWLGSAVLLGIIFSSGYWMLHLWQQFQNPFFPLLNGIFQSPYFPAHNWKDPRFLPHGWLQTLFYPFYFSFDGRTGDAEFHDFRFAIVYVLYACYALTLFRKKAVTSSTIAINWLLLFFLFTYIVWQLYFSIMRYVVALEMLAPLVIFLLLYRLLHSPGWRFSVATGVFIFIAVSMMPTYMVRAPWYLGTYFNVLMPQWVQEDKTNALIMVPYPAYAFYTNPRPPAYLLPFLPAQWHVTGIPFLHKKYEVPTQVYAFVRGIHPATLYLLASPEYLPDMRHIASTMGFSTLIQCGKITNDRQAMTHEDLLICKLKK